jgi:hypothetical protein
MAESAAACSIVEYGKSFVGKIVIVGDDVDASVKRRMIRLQYLHFCEVNLERLRSGETLLRLPLDLKSYSSLDERDLWDACPLNHREIIRNYLVFRGGIWKAASTNRNGRHLVRADSAGLDQVDFLKNLQRHTYVEHLPAKMTVLESITASKRGLVNRRRSIGEIKCMPDVWPPCAELPCDCWNTGNHSFSKTLISPDEMREMERETGSSSVVADRGQLAAEVKRILAQSTAQFAMPNAPAEQDDGGFSGLNESMRNAEIIDTWLNQF